MSDYQLLYHGTTSLALPEILKEGLRPVLRNSWHISLREDLAPLRESEECDSVYMAPDMRIAKLYAVSKCRYLKAKPGSYFKYGIKGLTELTDMWKEEDAPMVESAEPVVLQIKPDKWLEGQLVPDWKDMFGCRIEGNVPLKYIIQYATPKEVVTL